jgi:acetylornithine deacetylase
MPGNLIQPQRLYDLFSDMVDIYSPSGREEELVKYLVAYLERHSVPYRLRQVDETRANIEIGTFGDSAQLLFLGHIDTVPAYDIEHYELNERNGLLYGLGTTDMKSGCAAMLEAFLAVFEDQGKLPDHVLLSLVVGEEETGDGTQALLAEQSFDWAIVAEPTNMQPCMTHYGYIEMLVRAFGYRRHAAMSDSQTNAIRALLRLLLELEQYLDHERPATVLNIRDLHSSESGFAVPDRCASAIDLHFPPKQSAKAYAEVIKKFCTERLVSGSATRHEIEFPLLADGYELDAGGELPKRLHNIYKQLGLAWLPTAFKSHSDANLLRDAFCQPVILGPGQLAKAHTRDESIDFVQVIRAAEVYAELLMTGSIVN